MKRQFRKGSRRSVPVSCPGKAPANGAAKAETTFFVGFRDFYKVGPLTITNPLARHSFGEIVKGKERGWKICTGGLPL